MKLYVGNLPWSIDESKLKETFASFGNITEAVLIKDKFSGRSKGFGFVTFENEEDAKKAISEMHEKNVEGRPLTVSEAKPMVPRDNAPRAEYSGEESSEAPIANPSEINNQVEDEAAPEVTDNNSDAEEGEEKIETTEEAKKDASSDEPAEEKATEAKETTEEAKEEEPKSE